MSSSDAKKSDSKASEHEIDDPEQLKLMAEECIVVDDQDKVLGHATKEACHLLVNIRKGLLHRAFSVCLFNSKGELCLQQRAGSKITFPLRWTNTCCSHPLYFDEELDEKDHIGVKRAARRKLEHELGINPKDIELDEFVHMGRIHYVAECEDGKWGEHEVDHILFIQKDVEINFNKNEVEAIDWVTPEQLQKLFEDRKRKQLFISPWFHMIANEFLWKWWENLDSIIKNKGLNDGGKTSSMIYKLKLEQEEKPASVQALKTAHAASKATGGLSPVASPTDAAATATAAPAVAAAAE